ncbi:30S ribosomal protein S9 [Pyrobaculum aerophilum]|uniref:Small ribosomal subunit protein uS9 n=1 Tax=Pyrobaculum aerophilum TaxID=13773 RepID=A0A832SYL8_9CREN|nr:30S ribosomal protein S9 [Pyrobaculum aerophilum]MCX8137464.1 30S ribosomal protein S9 [Pyrobaculum aerophilum]HII46079.1 30S ribosomal protein S9 [Pyrobaculum aerophilum]
MSIKVPSAEVLQETPRVVISVGKKKTAVARAIIKPGIGRVRINGYPLELWPIEMARIKMSEPLILAGELAKKVDIDVNVSGGGYMGQAVAVRIAMARGLVAFFQSQELKELYERYDPYMLKGDPRRTEPKKPGIKHARSKRQKAYR